MLKHPGVRARTPVILQHHPIPNPRGGDHATARRASPTLKEGARNPGRPRRAGLVLHDHLHKRVHRTVKTRAGAIEVLGTTSASLLDPRDERMAGFNVYEIDDSGALVDIRSHRLDVTHEAFREVRIPRLAS